MYRKIGGLRGKLFQEGGLSPRRTVVVGNSMSDMSTPVVHTRARKGLWNHFLTFTQLLLLAPALWWIKYDHLPAPGWAVTFIAIAAALMSVHDQMGSIQKATWLLLMAAFLAAELRAISKDRWDNAEIQRIERQEDRTSFHELLTTEKTAMDNANGQYLSTLGQVNGVLHTTQSVSRLTKKNLFNITGGDSAAHFELVYMNGTTPEILIQNTGKYPVRNLSVQIEDVNKFLNTINSRIPHAVTTDDINKSTQNVNVGDLGSNQILEIPVSPEVNGVDLAHYIIRYSALNGGGMEVVYVRAGKDGVKHMAVWSGDSNQKEIRKVDPNFPPDADGKLPWLGTNP